MSIDELLKSDVNLDDYLREYGENSAFLLAYYLKDINKASVNYYLYSKYLTVDDKIKILDKAIADKNYNAINIIIRDIDNLCYDDSTKPIADKVFNHLIELDKTGQIDINAITGSVFLYRSNPIYMVKKNPKNISYLYNSSREVISEILNYLVSINYTITSSDQFFIDQNVLKNPDLFSFLLKNCKYDPEIDYYIRNKITELSNKEQVSLYYTLIDSGKRVIVNDILTRLNFNNYDYSTVIPTEDLYLNFDKESKDRIISLLTNIKNSSFSSNVVLIMNHVDMDMVNEAKEIIGDKLRIMPIANQIGVITTNYSSAKDSLSYDYEHIKKSEDKLDSYAKMVADTFDKDGELKSLSPLEKFIAAYILTSKFAPYKESNNRSESRSVYEFINSVNDTKIVCVGYTHLLREILYRMGITDTIDWSVGEMKVGNFTFTDHMRMIIHLVDPKYGIDGIYMSDPTYDNTESSETKFKHMLMSHDEALKIDMVSEREIRADETLLFGDALNVTNPYELFRKPIPKEALIKAHLALEHFLDKNMKMVKNGEYDYLEYNEMAEKLGFYDGYSDNIEELMDRLSKMSINEIENNYPALLDTLVRETRVKLENKLGISQLDKTFGNQLISMNSDGKIIYGIKCYYNSEDFDQGDLTIDDVNRLSELFPNNNIDKYYTARFYLAELDKTKTMSEQIEEIETKLMQFNEAYNNIVMNNEKR